MNKQQEEWKDKYDDLFGEDHNKICTGKKCNCHSEVKQFISSLLTQAHKEAREQALEEIKATKVYWAIPKKETEITGVYIETPEKVDCVIVNGVTFKLVQEDEKE